MHIFVDDSVQCGGFCSNISGCFVVVVVVVAESVDTMHML